MSMEIWEDMVWFCDECDDCLDDQSSFTGEKGYYTCEKCGCVNYIDPVVIDVLGEDDEPIDYEDL